LLSAEGEIASYVYKQKAPVRKFVDDYLRTHISQLTYEQTMQACMQITELGRLLTEQGVTIQVPDVDLLEIKAGEYPLQRFIYHFFMQCFWNPELSSHENAIINSDWYHPQLSLRHTLAEVKAWFLENNLTITHEFVDFYDITVRGRA
jgi:hypothetical protein